MTNLPPKEKIPEAYTAIEDHRISLKENEATVKSSNGEKEYLIKWKNNLYYSNDSATYWQNYLGYPIIAVLMLQDKLSLNKNISKYFKGINWSELNKRTKRDYKESVEIILKNISKDEQELIQKELNKVYEELKKINIELTKKKNL